MIRHFLKQLSLVLALTLCLLGNVSFAEEAAPPLQNPVVVTPKAGTYEAGKKMAISWSGATTDKITIELINENDALSNAINVATAQPSGLGGSGSLDWTIPVSLKSSSGYHIRIIGATVAKPGDKFGMSASFAIVNKAANAVNSFTVLTPNDNQNCAIREACPITWAYPENGLYTADADIYLMKVGVDHPIMKLATVKTADKKFVWNVPNDKSLISDGLYVSVSGTAQMPLTPKASFDQGANSAAFKIKAVMDRPAPKVQPLPKDNNNDNVKQMDVSGAPSNAIALGLALAPLVALIPFALFF